MNRSYAKTVLRLAAREHARPKDIVSGLVLHLKTHGRLKLLPAILRDVRTTHMRRQGLLPSLEAATEKEGIAAKKAAVAEGVETRETVINPSLIRGWRARTGGILIDRSAKRSLIELYRNITR